MENNPTPKRTPAQLMLLTLKGMGMGAADVVPGVSGGTIAFITGIYEELITGINNINLNALKIWKNQGFKSFWKHIHGTFFVFLFLGIFISIFSLAKIVTYLLDEHPILIWSFFFGLVLASAWLVGKTIKKWTPGVIIMLIIGTAVAFYISSIQTVGRSEGNLYIFFSGAIAICAMILPGISGSFILVLLGSYHIVLEAAKSFNVSLLAIFALGCLVGLLSFARLLKYLFQHFKELTIALLTGFLIGSLYKIWPWKTEVGTKPIVIHSDGREEYMTKNVLPALDNPDNLILYASLLMLAGMLLIIILERFAPDSE